MLYRPGTSAFQRLGESPFGFGEAESRRKEGGCYSAPVSLLPPLLALSLLIPSVPAKQITGFAGEPVPLTVTFALRDLLVNRTAPNRLTLHTPWGDAEGSPPPAPCIPSPSSRAILDRCVP